MAYESLSNELLKGTIRTSFRFGMRVLHTVMLAQNLSVAEADISNLLRKAALEDVQQNMKQDLAPMLTQRMQELERSAQLADAKRRNAHASRSGNQPKRTTRDRAQETAMEEGDAELGGDVRPQMAGVADSGQNGRFGTQEEGSLSDTDDTAQEVDSDSETEQIDTQGEDEGNEEIESPEDVDDAPTQMDEQGNSGDIDSDDIDPDAPTEPVNREDGTSKEEGARDANEKQKKEVDPDAPTELRNPEIGDNLPTNDLAQQSGGNNLGQQNSDSSHDEAPAETESSSKGRQEVATPEQSSGVAADEASRAAELNKAKNAAEQGTNITQNALAGEAEGVAGFAIPGTRMFLWETMGAMFEDPTFTSFLYVHAHFIGYLIKDYFDVFATLESIGVPTNKILEEPDTLQWVLFGIVFTLELLLIFGALVILFILVAVVIAVVNGLSSSFLDLFGYLKDGFGWMIDIFLAGI